MKVQFDKEFLRYTNFQEEIEVEGLILNEVLLSLFNDFPQLYAFLMCGDGKEANKTTLELNGEYLISNSCLWSDVGAGDVLRFGRDIPEGEGSVGKIILGAALFAAAVVMAAPTGGSSLWAWSTTATMMASAGAGMMMGGVGELLVGKPSLPSPDGSSTSATYTFSGIHNTTVSGTPIAVVYGRHRIGGHVVNAYVYSPKSGGDSFLYAQMGLCEGEIEEIEKDSVKINDRSALDYVDVSAYWRKGEADPKVGENGVLFSPTLSAGTTSNVAYQLTWTYTDITFLYQIGWQSTYSVVPVSYYTLYSLSDISSVRLNLSWHPYTYFTPVDASTGEVLGPTKQFISSGAPDHTGRGYKGGYVYLDLGAPFTGNLKINIRYIAVELGINADLEDPSTMSAQGGYIESYTLYNASLDVVDSNDVMYGFNTIENSVGYNIHVPNKSVATTNPDVPANDNIGAIVSTATAVNTVSLTVSAPALYSDGGLKGASVPLEFYYRKTYSDHSYESPNWIRYNPAGLTSGWDTIKSTKPTKAEISMDVTLQLDSTDYYDLKVVRAASSIENVSDIKKADSVYLKAVTEISYGELAYPCVALLGIRAKATDQLSGSMPTITSIVKGLKVAVPTGYSTTFDVTRYCSDRYMTQTWDGTLSYDCTTGEGTKYWTDNPVWCLYDLLTNDRYGLGKDFKILESRRGVMLSNFYVMAQYCDEYILEDGTPSTHDNPKARPRFSLNLVVDQAKSAREWVNVICASMRATLFNCEGIVYLDIDRPKAITQLFNMSNITEYTQSSTSFKSIPNAVQTKFNNVEKDYLPDSFILENRDFQADVNQTMVNQNLDLMGVTDDKSARDLSAYTLNKLNALLTSVTFKTGTDTLNSSVLEVIGIQHDVPMWGSGGRITAVDLSDPEVPTLSLSATFNYALTATSGSLYGDLSISIANPGEAPVVHNCLSPTEAGSYATIQITPVVGFTPLEGAVYILNFASNVVKPFIITSIARDENEFATITAIEYNANIYSGAVDQLGKIPSSEYSQLIPGYKTSITGFKAEMATAATLTGQINSGVDIWYDVPSSLIWRGLKVAYSTTPDTGPFKYTDIDRTGHINIPEVYPDGEYTFIGVNVWKDGSEQSISECLLDSVNLPYQELTVTQSIFNDNFTQVGVIGLEVDGSLDGSFTGRDCKVVWRAPIVADQFLNTIAEGVAGANQTRALLDYYRVTVYSPSGAVRRTERLTAESFIYTYDMNRSDGLSRTFIVEVEAVDVYKRVGKSSRITCSNASPSALV